jgi:hypothetical protein
MRDRDIAVAPQGCPSEETPPRSSPTLAPRA